MRKRHQHLTVSECFFFISHEYPLIGASPDGIVNCRCHNSGLLEIKCPWTYRGLSVNDYATKRESCLEVIDGEINLNEIE